MRLRIILASVAMQELGHGTTGGAGVALIDHVVHEVYQSRVTYKYWNSSQFTWPTKGWTIAYHPGWKLCTQSSMSKNKRILRIAARASRAEWYRRSSDEEYEDHEEHHQHKEYLHHQPPVGWNAVEVLQELALCSLHVSHCVIHVLVNSVMDNTAINTR